MKDWEPGADTAVLAARSKLLHAIRDYFYRQDVAEVITPTLGSRGVTDCQIQNLKLDHLDQSYYLQTSPEYAMKRLLASGSGSIYQICPAYRGGEQGRNHNIEFMMLEWYRVDFTLLQLMDDVHNLLKFVALASGICRFDFEELPRASYKELFEEYLGIDPHKASLDELRLQAQQAEVACGHISHHHDKQTISDYLDLLFSVVVEPHLKDPSIVYDYPRCQVALAQLGEECGDIVAKRFEVFVSGLELANGYLELGDASELQARMRQNNRLRSVRGLERIEPDQKLLSALSEMPECSGIALGIDRLLMVLLGKESLAEVLSFSSDRI